MLDSPPLPQLPSPLLPYEGSAAAAADHRDYSFNPSVYIIAAMAAFAIIAAASIYLILCFIPRSRATLLSYSSSWSSTLSSSRWPRVESPPRDQDPEAVIGSLPFFSLSSATSLDCAVCLSPFQLSDVLRLLPSCRHAFHSECIDTWLKTSLSCPLCRSPIRPIPPPPLPPATAPLEPLRSESFRIEIGSVSRRTDGSLGSSNYVVEEEEIEAAAVTRARTRPPLTEKANVDATEATTPPPASAEMAEGGGAVQRSWLMDYLDRIASSASSTLSSLRFSQRGSRRFNPSASVTAASGSGGGSWDLERNLDLHLEEEDGGFDAFYRWLLGV